ncbi:replication initiation protein RepZ (plasmid) [Plautia stali symbiont]|nr:replication initiation protein RepZ [Plautia stali symbiont]
MAERQYPEHWSQLDTDNLIQFWQGVDDGSVNTFLVEPDRKKTKRRRGDHSTKPKCENPSWFRPARYKKLGGQLGHAYNRLVMTNPETGRCQLRMHMSLHPFYVHARQRAGRKYAFRPEKQRLLDALWPVLISFCDAGKHTVGMCISRLARELSPKDGKGNVIPETEVTVSRLSNLIAEQVRFGTLGVSEETSWDNEFRKRLPKYVWITDTGFKMLGIDMVKLLEQQQQKLKESEERQALIREGILGEDEEISVRSARKRWYLRRSLEALKHRREKGAARKRANRLEKLPRDRQIYEMSCWLKKTLPADERYWMTAERLEELAVQHLCQLELALAAPPH